MIVRQVYTDDCANLDQDNILIVWFVEKIQFNGTAQSTTTTTTSSEEQKCAHNAPFRERHKLVGIKVLGTTIANRNDIVFGSAHGNVPTLGSLQFDAQSLSNSNARDMHIFDSQVLIDFGSISIMDTDFESYGNAQCNAYQHLAAYNTIMSPLLTVLNATEALALTNFNTMPSILIQARS